MLEICTQEWGMHKLGLEESVATVQNEKQHPYLLQWQRL
jgi:hypothetical protein